LCKADIVSCHVCAFPRHNAVFRSGNLFRSANIISISFLRLLRQPFFSLTRKIAYQFSLVYVGWIVLHGFTKSWVVELLPLSFQAPLFFLVHCDMMNRFRTSPENDTKIRVTVALFTSKNVNISKALYSSLLLQYVLIGFSCRFKALESD